MARLDRDSQIEQVAGALLPSVRLLVQRLRQTQAVEGDLSSPETSALARLDQTGPTTASELARLERISPQSMGATLGSVARRGGWSSARPTPATVAAPSCR